jgi:hypothetical protein
MPLLLGLHFKLQWTSLDLIGAARDGPPGCGAALPVRWRGLPSVL